jgi:hypothetical protein
MQKVQFLFRHIWIDDRNTAGFAVRLRNSIERRGIVDPVTTRLHNHIPRKTEMVSQGEQLLRPSIFR